MELSIDDERVRTRRLCIATPMYGGQCHVDYAFSIAQLSALCAQIGIGLRFDFHCNESLVMRARNVTVDRFLRSDDTHLMFIDADMGFEPRDVLFLLAMQDEDPARDAYDVLSAPYPRKRFAWDAIARAAKAGAADQDPAMLEKYAGGMVFNPIAKGPFPMDDPVEASTAGAGFMMIRRATLERFRAAHPELRYANDPVMIAEGQPAELFAFFDTGIDNRAAHLAEELRLFLAAEPGADPAAIAAFLADPAKAQRRYSNRFLSEDYMFCRRLRAAGMKLWSCPWMQLTHSGSYTFSTSLSHIAGA